MYKGGPLDIGSEVECAVDWNRRFDFMQQHSGQHLLSAIINNIYHYDTCHWELGREKVSINIECSDPLSSTIIKDIEDKVNEEIRAGLTIKPVIYTKAELEILAVEGKLPKEMDMLTLSSLPYQEYRVIEIDGLDRNACGGTHLKSTSEIQLIKILGQDKDRGKVRLFFVAGERARRLLHESYDREIKLSKLLSTPSVEHISAIEKLLKDKFDLNKDMKKIQLEYSNTIASTILETFHELNQLDNNNNNNNENKQVCKTIFNDSMIIYSSGVIVGYKENAEITFLSLIADTIIDHQQNALIFLYSPITSANNILKFNNLISNNINDNNISIGNEETENQNNERTCQVSGSFVFAGPKDTVDKLKSTVLTTIEGKGGGRNGRVQGQARRLDKISHVINILCNIYNK